MQLGIIILTSLVSVGFHLAVMELIFTFYGNPEQFYLSLSKLHQKLSKPLWYCPTCMASVYGTIAYWGDVIIANQPVDALTAIGWPIFVFCLAGLNGIILKIAKWS